MFEIYKFEFDCGFIDAETVKSYVDMGILSQADCEKIVGDKHEEANQATEG
ncbi:XkdX family protein [Lactobacillus helveticus]|uniref:XkdX family protein n=1 Tax=Lactobacillus helveticus TaxID=1587 RepID=UPI0013FDB9BC|nr:XkdX family protein [Lactobacillus helveticus]NHL94365.1 XkdX family protein [Lactobacillus helveticus]